MRPSMARHPPSSPPTNSGGEGSIDPQCDRVRGRCLTLSVWRIGTTKALRLKQLDLGWTLAPGRWHQPHPAGCPVVYAGESRALCRLEKRVHCNGIRPMNQALLRLDLPDGTILEDVRTLVNRLRTGSTGSRSRNRSALHGEGRTMHSGYGCPLQSSPGRATSFSTRTIRHSHPSQSTSSGIPSASTIACFAKTARSRHSDPARAAPAPASR